VQAAICRQHGSPEQLTVETIDDPSPDAGEVLIRIGAAAVNFPDVLILDNKYQLQVPTPFVPGSEFAGEVVELGPGVDSLAIGDRVFGSAMVGAFAELICVSAAGLKIIPDGVDFATAASFWVGHATAYHTLRSVAEVDPGDTVLVLGAAGGVGLASVELAQILGAQVIAAVSSQAKADLCIERGAIAAINYEASDLRTELRDIAPEGLDVVIDPVGGPYAEAALRGMRWGGRFVTIGYASGEIPRIPLNLVLLKGPIVKGFEIRTFAEHEPDKSVRDQKELIALLAEGRIAPHISATYELNDTSAALRFVADRHATGKVLIVP
jgi:NADPH2:quinone reductase